MRYLATMDSIARAIRSGLVFVVALAGCIAKEPPPPPAECDAPLPETHWRRCKADGMVATFPAVPTGKRQSVGLGVNSVVVTTWSAESTSGTRYSLQFASVPNSKMRPSITPEEAKSTRETSFDLMRSTLASKFSGEPVETRVVTPQGEAMELRGGAARDRTFRYRVIVDARTGHVYTFKVDAPRALDGEDQAPFFDGFEPVPVP